MPVEATLSSDGSVLNLVLSGEFDINRSLQIQDLISTYPDTIRVIRIDLENVTRMDASIFSTLLLLYSDKDSRVKIELINCDKTLARRLSLAGISRLINVRLSLTKQEPAAQDETQKDNSKDRQ